MLSGFIAAVCKAEFALNMIKSTLYTPRFLRLGQRTFFLYITLCYVIGIVEVAILLVVLVNLLLLFTAVCIQLFF